MMAKTQIAIQYILTGEFCIPGGSQLNLAQLDHGLNLVVM